MAGSMLWRASWRYLLRHPWQFGLSVLGVALGVAVVVAVDLANASAMRAFELSNEALAGRATHQVVAGSLGVPEALYTRVRIESRIRAAAPVIDGWVRAPGPPARSLRLLGVDPLAEASLRTYLQPSVTGGAGGIELSAFLTEPGAVALTATTASDLGVEVGDTLPVRVGGTEVQLAVVAVLQLDGAGLAAGLRDVLVADIATAQEVLARLGSLDRIDLALDSEAEIAAVESLLPPQARLQEAAARSATSVQMTRAFRTNLTAMSLLALLCGAFLIYNTMTFSVVQRRSLLGVLRAVGVTRRQVLELVGGEALLVGALGSSLGLIGGIALARLLVGLVARTINDLYFVVAVRDVHLEPASLAIGLLLGVATTLVAAAAPALEAAAASPRSALLRSDLEARVRRLLPRLAFGGAAVALAGVFVLALPGRSLIAAFVGLFALVLGAALAVPQLTAASARALAAPARALFGHLGALAARSIAASLSRTAVAVAALMIAVSVIVGVRVMVASFRTTLQNWMEYTLQADLYVSPVEGRDRGLLLPGEERLQRLRELPEVAGLQTIRGLQLPSSDGDMLLLVLGGDLGTAAGYRFKRGEQEAAWQALQTGAVWVSEPFAAARGVDIGDRLRLPTPAGERDYDVAGVFYSYASDRGAVMMAEATFRRSWQEERISGIAIRASPGASLERTAAEVRRILADEAVVVVSNRELREESLRVFDRTFMITGVLRVLVTLVAFVGVLAALSAQQLERVREFGTLRAVGMTPRQLGAVVTLQTALTGMVAGLAAVPLGTAMAWVMVYVINERSFGWSLQLHVPWQVLAEAPLVAVAAALLGGAVPAWRMATVMPAEALRQE